MSIAQSRFGGGGRRTCLSAVVTTAAVLAGSPDAWAQEPARLVFTPVPRCVVLDTRVTGQPLVTNVPRAFDVAGALANQGGSADCAVPFGPATAAAVRLVPIDPAAYGTLKVWPYGGSVPADSLVEFGPAVATRATADLLVPLCDSRSVTCTRDLIVRADYSGTHLVAEVAGYFTPERTYQAGSGLTQDGNTFSVDLSTSQSRVNGYCPSGSAIAWIDEDGSVVCESDHYIGLQAGAGIRVNGYGIDYTISVDTNTIQRRITGGCSTAITYVHEDGTVACAPAFQSGRRTGATACPTETTYTFPERFSSTPVVIVTPNGLSGVTAPPNTYCVVDNVTTSSFQFCCYGHLPMYVNWMATVVR
jgi:hypothetical protein